MTIKCFLIYRFIQFSQITYYFISHIVALNYQGVISYFFKLVFQSIISVLLENHAMDKK